jgi:hypothetical protein
MFIGNVVSGMAGGAVGSICRRRPRCVFAVALVTGCAGEGAAVVRIVRRGMPEDVGCPVICGMADIALLAGDEMAGRFARCLCAVMATATGARHVGMIEASRQPSQRGVARVALSCSHHVIRRFAGSRGTIVASGIRSGRDAAVIKDRWSPGVGVVAIAASVAAGDVTGRLSCGDRAVVATEAGAEDIGMIDPDDRTPGRGAMAVLAHVGSLNVMAGLAGRGATVMTTDAVAGHGAVVEACSGPAGSRVAVGAIVAAGDMRWWLAHGVVPVVAAGATAQNGGVINPVDMSP